MNEARASAARGRSPAPLRAAGSGSGGHQLRASRRLFRDLRLARVGPNHVPTTEARITIPPICVGHIDMRAQGELRNALRSDTPA
jgi:hypothetical protein